jgi:hypothetical protein
MSRLLIFILVQALRQLEVLLHVPPHILAGGIDQLEFEVIDCATTAQAEIHRILFGHLAAQGSTRHHETTAALEIEIHLQRRSAAGGHRRQLQRRIAGNYGLPFGGNEGNRWFLLHWAEYDTPERAPVRGCCDVPGQGCSFNISGHRIMSLSR